NTLAKSGVVLGTGAVAFAGATWLPRLIGRAGKESLAADRLSELARNAPRARFWISTATPEVNCSDCHQPNLSDCHLPELSPDEKSHDHGIVIIKCGLCAQACFIREGTRGVCRTRMNVDGELRSLVYGRPVSIHVDPIEKKPLFHFLPGKTAFSLATAGCPLHCKFCQNWELSQMSPEDHDTQYIAPETIANSAVFNQAPVIAFTYNEPTVFTEYLIDIARSAKKQNIRSVLISCGFMTEEPLTEMCEVLDAIKIDLKGFSEDFYQKVCSARLKPVLRSIKQIAKSGTHLEIVNLVVPTLNDSEPMLRELAKWVVNEIGPDVPVHYTRFHPDYQLLNLAPTPIATLERARDIAMDEGMHYAFVGNVPGHPGNSTYCPNCGKAVIERSGFFIRGMHLQDGKCAFCDEPVAGVWS
ncbi:MAG: AmmeMemoRadiSam system radical SAM enzyme, partial [Candidatus Electryonea clarkiae]|nr:AmmeMemoRadiSam system radical SAM enzyme [Candidatus Electryonea clarkiae]